MSIVLEREKVMRNEVPKDLSFNQGSLIIKNVPHTQHITTTSNDNYIEYTMRGSVSLRLSAITEYMEKKQLPLFNYNDYDKFPEIQQLLMEYM